MMRTVDIEGRTSGKLTVLAEVSPSRGTRPRRQVLCRCSCGVEKIILLSNITRGANTSCGCGRKDNWRGKHPNVVKHGDSPEDGASVEYSTWNRMKSRCLCPENTSFKDYGARGIAVCDRWLNDFAAFLADMGRRPSSKHSIDRYPDNDGNYEPGNCRWATPAEQVRNRRSTKLITALGKSQVVADWAAETGISLAALTSRIRAGWDHERAIRTPCRPMRRRPAAGEAQA